MSTFEEALEYLASFTDYEQKLPDGVRRRAMDLDRMRRFAAALGNPQERLAIVHVAGTKGKGSTTMMVDALVRAHGLSCGRFISPHLSHVTERIAIDGRPVDTERFADLVQRLRPYVEKTRRERPTDLPSFFESITMMAFLEFARRDVDVCAIEVGLGGRLDATNIAMPRVSVITTIDLEHTRVLGETLERIAAEKAGIIKERIPAVSGLGRDTDAGRAIATAARRRRASLRVLGEEIIVSPEGHDDAFTVGVDGREFTGLTLPRVGDHQRANAALALAAMACLEAAGMIRLRNDCVRAALETVQLPARVEFFDVGSGLGFDGPVVLDSAHTRASVRALVAALPHVLPARPRTLVVGLLRDKNVLACLEKLLEAADEVVAVTPPSPRALPAAELADAVRAIAPEDLPVMTAELDELGEILARSRSRALVVTGSAYLAGMIRPLLAVSRAGSSGSARI